MHAAPTDGDNGVQQAVEQFVERHSRGESVALDDFVQQWPADLQPTLRAQIQEFLAFDGMLGRQSWRSETPPATDGRTFGDFVVQEELGRGGMGIVYLAQQRSLNRRVALKVLASGLTLSKRHVERFRREAAATAQLRHPAIVPVHSFTEIDGTLAFAMDFVAGRNLADVLDDLRLANGDARGGEREIEGSLGLAPEKGYVAECAMLCAQVASALAAAHQAGVVHRDLKPRNLMIDERRQVRLLDFGLAKSLGEGSISMSGEITGTAHYMSPEQTLAKRVPVDQRTDVFSLGVILYELLTLRRPFDGKNLQQIVYEICFHEPKPPTHGNRKVPRDLATICAKALEKEPHNRYQTAAEFEADLLRFLRWEPVLARPASLLTRGSKFVRRHRTEVITATAVVLLAVSWLGYSWSAAATRSHTADNLLANAELAAQAGDFERAVQDATAAVGLRNDLATRAQLDLYANQRVLSATRTQKEIAEAALLAQHSNQQIDRDRELALQLALAAFDQRASSTTRTAVLDALGAGHRVTALDTEGRHVLAAHWSPDGTRVVGTTTSGTVLLWDAQTGQIAERLDGHSQWVLDAAFVPGSGEVATAGVDHTVRFWRLGDGRERTSWALEGAVTTVAFAADGTRALAASYVGNRGPFRAEVREATTGRRLGMVEHRQHVVAAAISGSGRYAASWGGESDAVLLWDATTGAEVARLGGHGDRVTHIAFGADDQTVTTAARDGALRCFAVPDGTALATAWHSRAIDALALDVPSRAGADQLILTGSRDQTARMWRLERTDGGATLRELRTFVGHGNAVTHVAFAPQGELVATASQDGVVRVFQAAAGSDSGIELQRYEVGPSIDAATFDRDGRRLLVRAGKQRLAIWDLAHNRGVLTLRQPGAVPAACFDDDGSRIGSAGDDERVRAWSTADGRLLWLSEPLGGPVQSVDAAGERLACSTVQGTIRIFDFAVGTTLATWSAHTGRVPSVHFTANGEQLLSAGEDGRVVLWDVSAARPATTAAAKTSPTTGTQVWAMVRPGPLVAADLDARGTMLVTVERDEVCARLWQLPGGEPRGELRGHDKALTWVQFAPDGAVLTASRDGTARLTRRTGELLAKFDAGQPIPHATLAHTGSMLLTSAADRTGGARLWLADGGEVMTFRGHRHHVEWGSLTRDGRWALTASKDGTIRVWPTDPVAAARRLPLRTLTDDERRRFGLADLAPPK